MSFLNLATRVAILPVLALTLPSPPAMGPLALGSFALLYSQLVLPTPSGAGAVELGFLGGAAGDLGTGEGWLLLAWRFYTNGIGVILGVALAARSTAGPRSGGCAGRWSESPPASPSARAPRPRRGARRRAPRPPCPARLAGLFAHRHPRPAADDDIEFVGAGVRVHSLAWPGSKQLRPDEQLAAREQVRLARLVRRRRRRPRRCSGKNSSSVVGLSRADIIPRPPTEDRRTTMTTTRLERDPLGEKPVPADALYGIQTLRAAENFPISGLRPLPAFVDAVVWIKRPPRSRTRRPAGSSRALADAIVKAADEVLGGQHRDQFIVDVYQAGAGTSHNMNVNEVLANRANELLGGAARHLHAGAPERSRQHGPEHQRRDPDRDAPGGAGDAARDAGRARRAGRRRCSPRAPRSTTSSNRAAPTCRTPRRSGWARSSRPTATPSSGTGRSWRRRPTGCAR